MLRLDETPYGRVDARFTEPLLLITAAPLTWIGGPEKWGVTAAMPAPAIGPFPLPPATAVPANTPTASASARPAAGKSLLVRMMSSPEVCARMNLLRLNKLLICLMRLQQVRRQDWP